MSLNWDVLKAAFKTTEGKMLASTGAAGLAIGLGSMGAVRDARRREGGHVGALTGVGTGISGGISGTMMGATLGSRFGWAGAIGGAVLGAGLNTAATVLPAAMGGQNSRGGAFASAALQSTLMSASTSLGAVMIAKGSLARTALVKGLKAIDEETGSSLLAEVRAFHQRAGKEAVEMAEAMREDMGIIGGMYAGVTPERIETLGFNPMIGGMMPVIGKPIARMAGGTADESTEFAWQMAYAGGSGSAVHPGADASLWAKTKYQGSRFFRASFGAPDLEQMVIDAGGLQGVAGGAMAKAYARDTIEGLPMGLGTAAIGSLFWRPPNGGGGSAPQSSRPALPPDEEAAKAKRRKEMLWAGAALLLTPPLGYYGASAFL